MQSFWDSLFLVKNQKVMGSLFFYFSPVGHPWGTHIIVAPQNPMQKVPSDPPL